MRRTELAIGGHGISFIQSSFYLLNPIATYCKYFKWPSPIPAYPKLTPSDGLNVLESLKGVT